MKTLITILLLFLASIGYSQFTALLTSSGSVRINNLDYDDLVDPTYYYYLVKDEDVINFGGTEKKYFYFALSDTYLNEYTIQRTMRTHVHLLGWIEWKTEARFNEHLAAN